MKSGVDVEVRRVRADVNYVRNPPAEGREVLEFVTEAEERSTMRTTPGRAVWIHDARSLTTELDREGFVLVPHQTSVTDFDAIEEDGAIDRLYTEEMAALLQQVTGAARVMMTGGGKKRYGEAATEKLAPLANAKPARYPHADNTDISAVELTDQIAAFLPDFDPGAYRRWALYNLWRCVSPPPQDIPLAVCDARTVATADEVTVTAVTMVRKTGELRHDTTGYLYNPDHRWYYFPDMSIGEVIVFKAHDSDLDRARRIPHTAFTDPTCAPGTPTRGSVEMRGLALFD